MYFVWTLTFYPVAFAMDLITVDLVRPAKEYGESCGFESCPALRPDTLNVHIVPHTHWELGYTADFYTHYTGDLGEGTKSQVNIKRALDYTITELWSDTQRKFTLSDMAYFFYWWKQRDGTVHRMVYELLRQGRLHFAGGGFSMPDEGTTSYHALIDMFTYSLEKLNATFLDCGRPLVSWQADVFGHSREFASLMAQMGFGGHFINPISYDDEVSRMLARSLEFVWRGSDDLGPNTDIFTHKLFDGYWSPPGFCFGTFCQDQLLIDSDVNFMNIEQRVQEFIDVSLHRQGPYYTTKNIIVMMGQRFGYFDAGVWFSNIDKLIRHVNSKSVEMGHPVNLFYSSPACYLKAVHEARPRLATKQDDFFPLAYDQSSTAVGFYTARPTFKYFVRLAHVYLQIAKQLQVTAGLTETKKFDSIMERFKWINGIMQDHTIITGLMPEITRKYYSHKLFIALQGSTNVDVAAFNKLRRSFEKTEYFRCSFNISLCQRTDAQQYYIVVYNPLAWPVTVKVRLPSLRKQFVVYHPSGKRVRASIMKIADPIFKIYRHKTYADHELVFIAEDIPAMGFRSYFIKLKNFGWFRNKREILKKVSMRNKKKYLVRQAYQNGLIEEIPEEDMGGFDYDYFDRPTAKPRIVFSHFDEENDWGGTKIGSVISSKSLTNDSNPKDAELIKEESELSDLVNVSAESVEMNANVSNVVEFDNNVNIRGDSSEEAFDKGLPLDLNVNFDNNNTAVGVTSEPVIDNNVSNITNDSNQKNVIDRNKTAVMENESIAGLKEFVNGTKFSNEIQTIRRFFDKHENNTKIDFDTTEKVFIIDTTTDIFNEIDTKPEIIVGPKNIYNKKLTGFESNENIENKIATAGNKLKYQEYPDFGASKYDENKQRDYTDFDELNTSNETGIPMFKNKLKYGEHSRLGFNKHDENKIAKLGNKLRENDFSGLGLSQYDDNDKRNMKFSDIEIRKFIDNKKKNSPKFQSNAKDNIAMYGKSIKNIENEEFGVKKFDEKENRKYADLEIKKYIDNKNTGYDKHGFKIFDKENIDMIEKHLKDKYEDLGLSESDENINKKYADIEIRKYGENRMKENPKHGFKNYDEERRKVKDSYLNHSSYDKNIKYSDNKVSESKNKENPKPRFGYRNYYENRRTMLGKDLKDSNETIRIDKSDANIHSTIRTSKISNKHKENLKPNLNLRYNNENRFALVSKKLKEKEYADLGISKSNEDAEKPSLGDAEEDMNFNTSIPAIDKLGNETRIIIKQPSQNYLKDSDFSDKKSITDDERHRNQTRKFNAIFGSDDEQMKNQMFGSYADKPANSESKNTDEILRKSNEEKWSIAHNMLTDVKNKSKLRQNVKVDKSSGGETPEITDEEKSEESKWRGYDYFRSADNFISNQYVKLSIDHQKRLSNITLSNGVNISFQAEMMYYASDDPQKLEKEDLQPGITMFRTMDPRAHAINDFNKVSVYKNGIVEELHYEFSSYASFVVRLYSRDPVIELEWQTGPVPVADNIGKEVFIRYTTDLKNDGAFFTDSNGRQTLKRMRNKRFTYEPMHPDYLAGNIYPVTSKIYIEDKKRKLRFAVFNDRPQGGTSLSDGEIDLFIHRRILTDDTNRGYLTLNETEYGEGIRVRGKHYIYLTKLDHKPNRIFEKKLAKEIELAPQIFVTKSGPYGKASKGLWSKHRNEFSAIKTKLPVGLHLLTLEKWGETGKDLLLRLENYLEKSDVIKSGIKKINLNELFVNIKITSIRETTLAANLWKRQVAKEKFEWKSNSFFKSFNDAYGDQGIKDIDKKKLNRRFQEPKLQDDIVLVPQQIRTFYATYEYIGD